MRKSTWRSRIGVGLAGTLSALTVAAAAGHVLEIGSKPGSVRILIPLSRSIEPQPQLADLGALIAHSRARANEEVPPDIAAACKLRHPRSRAQRRKCTRLELEALAWLERFPAGWSFAAETTQGALGAAAAGNPGAKMFLTCAERHGSGKSRDGFPDYSAMKTCLIAEQEARNRAR